MMINNIMKMKMMSYMMLKRKWKRKRKWKWKRTGKCKYGRENKYGKSKNRGTETGEMQGNRGQKRE